jgi:hypothetical protein
VSHVRGHEKWIWRTFCDPVTECEQNVGEVASGSVFADHAAEDLSSLGPGSDVGCLAGLPLWRLLLQPQVWTVAVIGAVTAPPGC